MSETPLQNDTPDRGPAPQRPASNTAWGVLVLRAVHQILDDEPRILVDPIAPRLIDVDTITSIRGNPAHFQRTGSRAIRGHVVTRSRYAEDRLADAVRRGVTQCIVLGAGYDTFAYRQPEWASSLRVFEVDHPASQQAKIERLRWAGVTIPANVTFAGIDFEHESLADGLRRSGFDPAQQTFISCLGVLVYLTAEAAEGVFRFAASLVHGSELVSTFKAITSDDDGESPVGAAAAAAGEPWLSRFDPDELELRLRAMGFANVTMISGAELEVRYALRRRDGVYPPRKMMMVSATT